MTTFTTRSNANSNASVNEQKAEHYLNIYCGKTQIGYLVLDKFPELVEICQRSENNATKLLHKCLGVYRQAGVSNKVIEIDLSDFD